MAASGLKRNPKMTSNLPAGVPFGYEVQDLTFALRDFGANGLHFAIIEDTRILV
jgi:hypothetical protein